VRYIDDLVSGAVVDKVGRIKGEVTCKLDRVHVSAAAAAAGDVAGGRGGAIAGRVLAVRGRVRRAARRGRPRVHVARRRRGFGGVRRRRRRRRGGPTRLVQVLLVALQLRRRRRTVGARLGDGGARAAGGTVRRRRPQEIVAHLRQRAEEVDAAGRRRTVHWRHDAWNGGINAGQIEVEVTTEHARRICRHTRASMTSQHSLSLIYIFIFIHH